MKLFSEPADWWLGRGCILCVPLRAQVTRTLAMKHGALVPVSQAPGGEPPRRPRSGGEAQEGRRLAQVRGQCQALGGSLVLPLRPSGSLGTRSSSWTRAVPASEENAGGSRPPSAERRAGTGGGPSGRSRAHTHSSRGDPSVHEIVSRRDCVRRPTCFIITKDSVFRRQSRCWPAVGQKRTRLVFYKPSFG